MIMKDYKADEGLQGNDKIEKANFKLKKILTGCWEVCYEAAY